MKIFLTILVGFAIIAGTLFTFANNRPERPEPVAVETIRCDLIADELLTIKEAKNLYDELCGTTHPIYNCRAIGEAEFHWQCWGFRKDLEPNQQLDFEKHPSADR